MVAYSRIAAFLLLESIAYTSGQSGGIVMVLRPRKPSRAPAGDRVGWDRPKCREPRPNA